MRKDMFSNNDLKRGLRIPSALNSELAEETGIHIGDGNLGVYKNGKSLKYSYGISSWTGDEKYLRNYVVPLLYDLYGIYPSIYKTKASKSIEFHYQSKGLINFKKSLGLPLGKKENISIPEAILNSNFKRDFIRGLFDTDGAICFRRRYRNIQYYPTISLTSISKILILQVSTLLRGMGFKLSLTQNTHTYRNGKKCKLSRIDLYGKENLLMWMELIGTSKPTNIEKFNLWKKFGYIPEDCKEAPEVI